jgi:hypothetical protein
MDWMPVTFLSARLQSFIAVTDVLLCLVLASTCGAVVCEITVSGVSQSDGLECFFLFRGVALRGSLDQ